MARLSDRDLIMLRALIHSSEESLGSGVNNRFALILAGKLLYPFHRVESQERDKLNFIAGFTDKQFRAVITFNIALRDPGKYFVAQHFLVGFCVLPFGPAVPDARDHFIILPELILLLMLLLILETLTFYYEYEHEHDGKTS